MRPLPLQRAALLPRVVLPRRRRPLQLVKEATGLLRMPSSSAAA